MNGDKPLPPVSVNIIIDSTDASRVTMGQAKPRMMREVRGILEILPKGGELYRLGFRALFLRGVEEGVRSFFKAKL